MYNILCFFFYFHLFDPSPRALLDTTCQRNVCFRVAAVCLLFSLCFEKNKIKYRVEYFPVSVVVERYFQRAKTTPARTVWHTPGSVLSSAAYIANLRGLWRCERDQSFVEYRGICVVIYSVCVVYYIICVYVYHVHDAYQLFCL